MKGIATQRFTWSSEAGRPDAEKTVAVFLREAAAAGCDAVEDGDPEVLAQAGSYGLRVSGAYVGVCLHESREAVRAAETVLPLARRLAEAGADYLLINADPKGGWGRRERKTADELQRQGEHLSWLAEAVAPLGLHLALHNHANRLDQHLDDLTSVLDHAEPAVGLCLDLGWAWVSGDDPVALIRRLGRRVTAVHLRNQYGEVPAEWLGEGDLDPAAVVAALREVGYDGWLTCELWHRSDVTRTRSLLEDQRLSSELLRRLWAEAGA